MATYSLADLIPEPHIFKDQDGTAYAVPTGEMLSTLELKQIAQLERDLPEALATWKSKPDLQESVLYLDKLVNDYFGALVREMKPERIEHIPINQKVDFIRWWQTEEGAKAPPAPPAPARANRQTRRRASRGSSTPDTTPSL